MLIFDWPHTTVRCRDTDDNQQFLEITNRKSYTRDAFLVCHDKFGHVSWNSVPKIYLFSENRVHFKSNFHLHQYFWKSRCHGYEGLNSVHFDVEEFKWIELVWRWSESERIPSSWDEPMSREKNVAIHGNV